MHAPHAARDPSEYSPTPRFGCPSAHRRSGDASPANRGRTNITTMFRLTSVLGGDKQNWIRPILAFSTRLALLLATLWVRTRPSTSSQSSMVPLKTRSDNKPLKHKLLTKVKPQVDWTHPSFLMILTSWRSTLVAVAGSITRMTASTLMGASRLEYCDTTLEHRDVVALLSSVSRSLSCTGWLMVVSTSTPLSTAFWKDSEMMVGWMPARHNSQSRFILCI